MNKKSGVFSPLLLLAAFISRATVVYVDSSNTNANQNGASWTTAFSGFQNAINAAASGDTLWVARGTYSPPSGGSFTMKEGVKIFGGFRNTYSNLNQRNWSANPTYLRGNGNISNTE